MHASIDYRDPKVVRQKEMGAGWMLIVMLSRKIKDFYDLKPVYRVVLSVRMTMQSKLLAPACCPLPTSL